MGQLFPSIRGHTFYGPSLGVRPRILDLGANHGRFAREVRERYGADVCAVEANPELYRELSTREGFPTLHCAVIDKEGAVEFNLARNDAGSSILELPPQSVFNSVLRETVTVPARTVASILEDIGWDGVDLIKMDIEGAEVCVLESLGPEILDHVKQFTIEFHSDPIFGFNIRHQVEVCLKKMRKHGFLVMDFSFPSRCDVLLINTRLIELNPMKRAWWKLIYNPPKPLYRLLRKMPTGLRAGLKRWHKRLIRPRVLV
jgi:FkbM family methyltransferase